jgi:hypothetical protein
MARQSRRTGWLIVTFGLSVVATSAGPLTVARIYPQAR